jgi:hypothetical protein
MLGLGSGFAMSNSATGRTGSMRPAGVFYTFDRDLGSQLWFASRKSRLFTRSVVETAMTEETGVGGAGRIVAARVWQREPSAP